MTSRERVDLSRWPRQLAGILAPYGLVAAGRHLDCLYLLQLERYKPDRYVRWVRAHWRRLLTPFEIGLQAATTLGVALLACLGTPWPVLYIGWIASGALLLRRWRSLQVSQHLQWTSRAVRAAAVACGISACLVAAGVLVAGWTGGSAGWTARLLAGGVAGMALAGLLAPVSVLGAGRLLAPVEQAIARRFLGEAARRMRAYPGRVVGITGSYGKTTTKHILGDLLASRYRVLKTPAGVNTTMGITRVVREELKDDQEIFVVEMSAYGPGEIREVCDLVHPSLGILTAVGVQHLERFGTPERIAEAKYELVAALPAGAPAVINADDPVCVQLARRARAEGKRVLLYGLGEPGRELAVCGLDLTAGPRGSRFRVVVAQGGSETFETPLLGRWNISNVLGAIAAALECGLSLDGLRGPVAALQPAPRRLEIKEEGGILRILDVANANPRGAEMALEVLGQFAGGSRILITPGMVELGPLEAEENRRFGQRAAAVCDYVVLVGPAQTRPIRQGLLEAGFAEERIRTARHSGEVADHLAGIVRPGDVLLYENRLPDTYLEVEP